MLIEPRHPLGHDTLLQESQRSFQANLVGNSQNGAEQ
jgi:hypothetical protein